jgi:hypothetical protein
MDQAAALYPTSGSTLDWAYGYSHYVLGRPTFSYCVESCNTYHPSESYLDQVIHENYDGAFYALQEAENISNIVNRVIPPVISNLNEDYDGNYEVVWIPQNTNSNVSKYQLDELSNMSIYLDDAENGTNLWVMDGFTESTDQSYSSTTSFKSRYQNSDVSYMKTAFPIPVKDNMNLSFWCWYDIENNYDKAHVEVSKDDRYYVVLESFTGTSTGWEYKTYDLSDYNDESIYIRFRYTTDSYTLDDGFYVDDITPVVYFNNVTTLSDNITTTYYQINNKDTGEYYYQVKGYNTEHGWCDFSTLELMNVTTPQIPIYYQSVSFTPEIQDTIGWVNITCEILSMNSLNQVKLIVTHPDSSETNNTMINILSNQYYLNITYNQIGTYNFYIWVDDTYGNQSQSDTYQFYIGVDVIDISFGMGWNLITIPVETDWWASDISGNLTDCLSVSGWDAVNQTYKTYITGGPPTFNFELLDGYGYFVDIMNLNPQSLRTVGSLLSTVNIQLEIGWNLIGWYHDYDTLASNIAANITGCLSVSAWDSINQTYQTYIVGGPPSFDFTITQNMGLFVDVDQISIWYGN